MVLVFNKVRHLCITIILFLFLFKTRNFVDIRIYKDYITMCKKSIKFYEENEKNNNQPFFSICIPVYNMEKYIEISLLSVLNQSFRDFEIVIVNDYSQDNSKKIIENFQSENSKIRLINHGNNLGVYKSRVDAIKNSKGNYIIFLDPDDIISNSNLLNLLNEYNYIYNEDIIEFTVIEYRENDNKLYFPSNHRSNHFHNFHQHIIYHPNLSNILFFENTKYSDVFCRCIWNKMIRKEILFKTINFLGSKAYYKKHFDFAEDTIINILNFEFASNYSNLHLIGYMYNIREESMSHSNKGKDMNLKMTYNLFFFYILFHQYIKHFNKDLNYLYFDLKAFDYYLNYINQYNSSYSKKKPIIKFYKKLLKESNISNEFKTYIKTFLSSFKR